MIFTSTFFLSIFPFHTPVTCCARTEMTKNISVQKGTMRFIKVFSRCMDVLTEKDNNNCLLAAAFLWYVVVNTYTIIGQTIIERDRSFRKPFINAVIRCGIKNPGFHRGFFILKILLFVLYLFQHFFYCSFQLGVLSA
jgi:hypothetical protein